MSEMYKNNNILLHDFDIGFTGEGLLPEAIV